MAPNEKIKDEKLLKVKDKSPAHADEQEQEHAEQARDVTAAARDDDEGSHEPGQSRGSMSSDRGLRAQHTKKRTSVTEQEELSSDFSGIGKQSKSWLPSFETLQSRDHPGGESCVTIEQR